MPAHAPEHKSTWNYGYTNTLPPMLLQPAQSYKPQSLLDWNRLEPQNRWFHKKAQKCGTTGSPCLDKPVLGRGGGGGQHQLSHVANHKPPEAPGCVFGPQNLTSVNAVG